ncbi:MAG TPA: DUF1592 domain-containing protein [Polyangia bacterium]|nr:DUF1592 domain-containing protein [Polyangia bacterium]
MPSPRLLRQLTLSEYRNTVGDLLQISNPDTTNIPADVPVRGFTTNTASAFIDQSNVDRYQSVGGALADRAITESFAKLVPCQTTDSACAGKFVETFGLRAFRRPVTPDEKTRYLALFDPTLTGGDFPTGVGLVIKTMLISPFFLMRSELGDQMNNGQIVLTPYEIASALSYGYTGSMPDDALFAAAQSGALASKSEIETQARRLVASDRGRARIAAFAGEWMEASRAFVATKDPMTFPALKDAATSAAIVDAMKAESDAFFTSVAYDGTKKWDELFSANYTFANDRLAAYYGLPMPGSPDKAVKVTLPAGSPRGGLLTLGMFLFGHARADQSSPTQRGHVIRANIFCTDVAPPPPGVDATVKPGTPGNTGREQIEALTGSGSCNACHSLMNPIGYGLEGFDGAAQVRTMDHGEMVDTSGVINGVFAQPLAFNGPRALSTIVAGNKDAQACLAKNYYRYVRGFDPIQTGVSADGNAVELLGRDFASGNLDMTEMFVRVALQNSFTVRRSVEALNR